MGRLEAFALKNKPLPSILDGIGNGLGYAGVLVIVGFCRELFGSGKIFGYRLIREAGNTDPGLSLNIGVNAAGEGWYLDNGLMLLAPGAFILLGLLIWVQRYASKHPPEDA
jgi:Na+-transporting NADH:ubiquinone oxidoreductase subunit D